MTEDGVLQKTNRINLLFDFYQLLLTEKQQVFLKYYFHDDYSLGEIASEFQISRQAVFEHIKRAESVLDEYEAKLQLLAKHEQRQELLQKLERLAALLPEEESKERFREITERLSELD